VNAARPSSAGFTAIEMMVVVSIIILLVAMTVPSIFPAIKKGRVHDAANAIMRVASQARQLARTRQQPATAVKYYGVAVVVPSSGPAYAVLTYDSSAAYSASSELKTQNDATKNIAKFEFNRNVMPYNASAGGTKTLMTTGTAVNWYYQYRTGFVIRDGTTWTTPINVGTPAVAAVAASGSTPAQPAIPAGTPPDFGVCSLDQQYIVAVAIYSIGLGNAQDMK
jgi:type II secretory pathway pseudopilin PulG